MYRAQFLKLDGLDRTHIGNGVGLGASTITEAEEEALALTPPEGANFVQVLLDGKPVSHDLGFAL